MHRAGSWLWSYRVNMDHVPFLLGFVGLGFRVLRFTYADIEIGRMFFVHRSMWIPENNLQRWKYLQMRCSTLGSKCNDDRHGGPTPIAAKECR